MTKNFQFKIFNFQKNRGFTIIESLVAISILVTTITGVMSAVQSAISSYILSKDQITAFYLAQEGFEQIRNLRDENRLNDRHWLHGFAEDSADPCYFGQACTISPVETTVPTRCSAPGSCPFLKQESSTGFYAYNVGGPLTIYRREVMLSLVNAHEVAVTVTVNWSKGSVVRQFKARENLLNWQ